MEGIERKVVMVQQDLNNLNVEELEKMEKTITKQITDIELEIQDKKNRIQALSELVSITRRLQFLKLNNDETKVKVQRQRVFAKQD